jgi:hypothetical protein
VENVIESEKRIKKKKTTENWDIWDKSEQRRLRSDKNKIK